jgi:hypothetical protein
MAGEEDVRIVDARMIDVRMCGLRVGLHSREGQGCVRPAYTVLKPVAKETQPQNF